MCDSGATAHVNCTHCECSDTNYTARVVARKSTLALPDVIVSPENYPQLELARTGSQGRLAKMIDFQDIFSK